MRVALGSRRGLWGLSFITCRGGMEERVLPEQCGPPGLLKHRGSTLSRHRLKRAAWLGQPVSHGAAGAVEAELPLGTPALHAPSPSTSPQPCWDVPWLQAPPGSHLGTASDTRCPPCSLPHPNDTGHAGPCAVSPLLIIDKTRVQPTIGCETCLRVWEEVPREALPCLGGAFICSCAAPEGSGDMDASLPCCCLRAGSGRDCTGQRCCGTAGRAPCQHGVAGASCRDVRFAWASEKLQFFSLSRCREESPESPSPQPQCPASPSLLTRLLSAACAPGSPAVLRPTAETSLPCLCRTDIKGPNFSCILYALRVTHRAQVHGESVHFKKVRDTPGWGSAAAPHAHQDWLRGSPQPRQDPRAMLMLSAPCRRRGVWWWQTSTEDPERMQRHWCPHLPQGSSPAPVHKCPRAVPRSGMTGSTLPMPAPAQPGHPSPGWESLTLPSHRAEFIRGKHGVEIVSEHDQDNGHIRFPVVPGETRTVVILVQNHGAEAVTLRRCQPHQQSRELSFTDEQGATQGQSLLLHPGRTLSPALRPALPEEMQDPALASLPRRRHVPLPRAVPGHLQWVLPCHGGLRVHQGAGRALQHQALRRCRGREPAGQGPGALSTFPALPGQPPAPCHRHH